MEMKKKKTAISSQDKFFSDRRGCLNSQQQKDDLSQKWGKNTLLEMAALMSEKSSSVKSLYYCSFFSSAFANMYNHHKQLTSSSITGPTNYHLKQIKGLSPCPHPTEQGWSDHETLQQGGGLTPESVPVGPTGHCYFKYATLMRQLQTTAGIPLEPLLREFWKRGQWFFILHT